MRLVLYGALSGRIRSYICQYSFIDVSLSSFGAFRWSSKDTLYYLKESMWSKKTYTHVSFFALEDTIITLEGFTYPLYKEPITVKDIFCVSNSIVHEEAKVTLDIRKVALHSIKC